MKIKTWGVNGLITWVIHSCKSELMDWVMIFRLQMYCQGPLLRHFAKWHNRKADLDELCVQCDAQKQLTPHIHMDYSSWGWIYFICKYSWVATVHIIGEYYKLPRYSRQLLLSKYCCWSCFKARIINGTATAIFLNIRS